MTKKRRTILLNDVNDTDIINIQGEFIWTFHDYHKNIDVKIKLERWWIKFLSENLWAVIRDEESELIKLEQALKGESDD